ncbi:DUF6153 family protein [Microbacterium sp. DT81.1]|uniref:DUF6153 family protein n=1 Tax=Microbacterium sp. DT81.1 TaxID=3393413 RepID=UPI003CF45EE0
MSLIALAQHLRGRRTLTRTRALLVLVMVTGGIIIGLLAMHSLNTHTAAAAHPQSAAITAHDEAPHTHDGESAPAHDLGCPDCGEHESMMAMMCVLGLLATLLVLIRPTRVWHVEGPAARPGPELARRSGNEAAKPPSLTVLCISRT